MPKEVHKSTKTAHKQIWATKPIPNHIRENLSPNMETIGAGLLEMSVLLARVQAKLTMALNREYDWKRYVEEALELLRK